jgi:hypothetical protein
VRFYTSQLAYVNSRIIQAVDGILANSQTPPIIILQGDHGPGAYLQQEDPEDTCLQDRLSILNACYLPADGGVPPVYDSMTPVNTFRVILDFYFGTSYGPLPDECFFVTKSEPYKFIGVTGEMGSPADMERLVRLKNQDYFDKPVQVAAP